MQSGMSGTTPSVQVRTDYDPLRLAGAPDGRADAAQEIPLFWALQNPDVASIAEDTLIWIKARSACLG